VEFVLAVLTLHLWKAPVNSVHDAIADITLLNAIHLFIDVVLPK
jgi:hypothetical protein